MCVGQCVFSAAHNSHITQPTALILFFFFFFFRENDTYLSENVINKNMNKPMQLPFKSKRKPVLGKFCKLVMAVSSSTVAKQCYSRHAYIQQVSQVI